MYKSPEEFLEFLSQGIVFHDGAIHVRGEEDRDGLFGDTERPRFTLLQPVDLFLEGPCADHVDMLPSRVERDAPMSRMTFIEQNGARKENMSILDHVFEKHPMAKRVVCWAECCSSYGTNYKKLLQEMKPNVEWVFPRVPDLCDTLRHRYQRRLQLAEALIAGGVLALQG